MLAHLPPIPEVIQFMSTDQPPEITGSVNPDDMLKTTVISFRLGFQSNSFLHFLFLLSEYR